MEEGTQGAVVGYEDSKEYGMQKAKTFVNISCFMLLVGVYAAGCDSHFSKETLILLPGEINGEALIITETSASCVHISDKIPSKISRVWWNEDTIVTENFPTKQRNKYSGDTYEIVDYNTKCWYIIHTPDDIIEKVSNLEELKSELERFGVDMATFSLMQLSKAQILREKQLGFPFSTQSIYKYLEYDSQNGKWHYSRSEQ